MATCLFCAQFDRYVRLHAKVLACFSWLYIMPLIFWFLFIPAHVILYNIFCILYSTPYLHCIGRLTWWKMTYQSFLMVWRNMVYTSFFFLPFCELVEVTAYNRNFRSSLCSNKWTSMIIFLLYHVADDGAYYFDDKLVDAHGHQGPLSASSAVVRGITAFAAVSAENLNVCCVVHVIFFL